MVHKIKKYSKQSTEGQYVTSCSTNLKSSLFYPHQLFLSLFESSTDGFSYLADEIVE